MRPLDAIEAPACFSIEDEKFDQIFPPQIRKLSPLCWTPVAVAAEAAKWLVTKPGTRVLDVGAGPGKFCLVAAALTDGHFTGVEKREHLGAIARKAAADLLYSNLEIVNGNITDVAFVDFDAFYIYNPFEERIPPELFKKYTGYVAAELGARPIGTRVATYAGYCNEIPACYDCEAALFDDDLKFWIKRREYDADIEQFGLRVSRSYRGAQGWREPRD